MKNAVKDKINIVYMLLTLVSILGVIFAIGLFIRDVYLETVAVETEAKILSIDYNNKQRYATVTYEVDNENIVLSTPLNQKQEELTVNDRLTIKYHINNPSRAIYNDHLKEILIIVFISLFGVIITTNKTLNILNKIKELKALKTNGIKLTVNIVDIYIDVKSPAKKGIYPHRIRTKYINPNDNKEYTFDSECIYNNTIEYIKNNKIGKITVYLDQNNTNIYYVDIDSLKDYIESIKVEDETNKQDTIDNQETYKENK